MILIGLFANLPDRSRMGLGPKHPVHTNAALSNACPRCAGEGITRNPKHFFYAVSLVASGVLVFFQWPPVSSLVLFAERCAETVGLRAEVGVVLVWTLASLPSIFGLAFLFLWLSGDTCMACRGHGRIQKW